jgi:hypothetical protein
VGWGDYGVFDAAMQSGRRFFIQTARGRTAVGNGRMANGGWHTGNVR